MSGKVIIVGQLKSSKDRLRRSKKANSEEKEGIRAKIRKILEDRRKLNQ